MKPTRRHALALAVGGVTAGAAGLLVARRIPTATDQLPIDPPPARMPSPKGTPPDQLEIVETLIRSDGRSILPATAALIHRGATADDLLSALCIAPALTGSDTGDVHSALVAAAIDGVIADVPVDAPDRWMPIMWAMHNATDWIRDDEPAPRPAHEAGVPVEAARDALFTAIQGRDERESDRALIALLASAGRRAAFDALAVAGLTSPTDPHRVIYLNQMVRSLARWPGLDAEALLRSVARYMARTAMPTRPHPPPPGRMPAPLTMGEADAETTRWLREALRESTTDELTTMLGAVAAETLTPLWDAIVLTTFDALHADPSASGAGVHLVSLVDAARAAFDGAAHPDDARFIAARTAHWVAREARSFALRPIDARPAGDETTIGRRIARRQAMTRGSDAHDFKVVAAVCALGRRATPVVHDDAVHALTSTRPWRNPVPWTHRRSALALLTTA